MGPRPSRPLSLSRRSCAAAIGLTLLATLTGAVPATGEPAAGGQFIPGTSLGGVELGMTRAEVAGRWGARHGVCRDCAAETWYFNERPFEPQGAGVVFDRGRVVHAFTLWQPEGWFTPEKLELGAPAGEIGATYGELDERTCPGYSALVREEERAESVFYVYEDEVWGFGLVTAGRSPCV